MNHGWRDSNGPGNVLQRHGVETGLGKAAFGGVQYLLAEIGIAVRQWAASSSCADLIARILDPGHGFILIN